MRQLQASQSVSCSFGPKQYIHVVYPKNQSKILVNVKENTNFDAEDRGPSRAKKFNNQCEQIAELRKMSKMGQYGSIQDRDLAMEVPAQDWPKLYKTNFELFCKASEKAVELADMQIDKQEMYIFREQEYRKTIEELKK